MYPYRRPSQPSRPKTPKIQYIAFAVAFIISAAVITNHIHRDFTYRHGPGPSVEHTAPSEPASPVALPAPRPQPEVISAEPTPTPEPTPEPTPPPRVPRQEFLDLRAQYGNDDIVGRVWIPGTNIDYLVTQGTDNSFYLDHDIHGRRYIPGWIFLDYQADIDNHDQNWVIFGHNMNRDHKFHSVRRFLDEDFFLENRYIHFSTIYADYVFEIFSVYITHVRFPYIHTNFDHMDGGWEYWINSFSSKSLFDAGITVSGNDRILTLSTCYMGQRDYRIPLHARLISETFPHLEAANHYAPDTANSIYE